MTPAQQKRTSKKENRKAGSAFAPTPKQVKKDMQHEGMKDRHLRGTQVKTQYIEHGSKFDRSMSELDAGL